MSSDRWQLSNFQDTRSVRLTTERLDQSCHGDLRQEVPRLLPHEETAKGFLEGWDEEGVPCSGPVIEAKGSTEAVAPGIHRRSGPAVSLQAAAVTQLLLAGGRNGDLVALG
jgi:hypothetical protein